MADLSACASTKDERSSFYGGSFAATFVGLGTVRQILLALDSSSSLYEPQYLYDLRKILPEVRRLICSSLVAVDD